MYPTNDIWEKADKRVEYARLKHPQFPSPEQDVRSIIKEEFDEFLEALDAGDDKAATYEAYDCMAVLYRYLRREHKFLLTYKGR